MYFKTVSKQERKWDYRLIGNAILAFDTPPPISLVLPLLIHWINEPHKYPFANPETEMLTAASLIKNGHLANHFPLKVKYL